MFTYMGFNWNIELHSVSVPDKKCRHVMLKLESILDPMKKTFTHHDIPSLHGSLQHLTFIYRDGCHVLTSLLSFLGHFPNDYVKHHIPKPTHEQLSWWHIVLSHLNVSHSLMPLASINLSIWIDTSTSWGISLLVGSAWDAWMLLPGQKHEGCNIRWAECIAIELAVIWLSENSVHDCDVTS